MEPNLELRLLNYKLRIMSIKKSFLSSLMFPIVKIAFTDKTKCTFFSFVETNDDYTIVLDHHGFEELLPFINELEVTISQSTWIPVYISGDDLPGSMSLSKIAKYLILPLADSKISILALSMYQCDYVLIQEKDYEIVVRCLSSHMSKIYDESRQDSPVIYSRNNGIVKSIFSNGSSKQLSVAMSPNSVATTAPTNFSSPSNTESSSSSESLSSSTSSYKKPSPNEQNSSTPKQRQITLPLLIPEGIEFCITGLYNLETFFLIVPALIEIMFYETKNYEENEIFFNFTKKETDISLVMETRLLEKFSSSLLNTENSYWKLVRIGQLPVGFEVFGVVASISQPLELANIDEYYISSFHTGYCFIPSDKLDTAKELFSKRRATFVESKKMNLTKYLKEHNGDDDECSEYTNGNHNNLNGDHDELLTSSLNLEMKSVQVSDDFDYNSTLNSNDQVLESTSCNERPGLDEVDSTPSRIISND